MQRPRSTKPYQAPAVSKAFKILDAIAASEQGAGISDLARQLGYSKGTTHGLTQALMAAGAIFKSPVNQKFFIGPAITELSLKNRSYDRIVGKAQPLLDSLRDDIGESVFLGVLSSPRAIILATAEPARPLKISSPPGSTIPILAGAVGKIFLSALEPEQVADILSKEGLKRFTEHSILDPKEYLEELYRVGTRGYALDEEEYLPGINAVAMHLKDQHGLMLALWVVGFRAAFGPKALSNIVQKMQDATKRLNRVLSA